MIDMSNISRDFMPRRRRPEEEGFAPQMPGAPQQVGIGQPQPFAPVGGPQIAPQDAPPESLWGQYGQEGPTPSIPPGGIQMGTTPTDPTTGRPWFETQMQQQPGMPPGGGVPQMATTMQPGAPGYEEHMAHMQRAQEIGPQMPGGGMGVGQPPTGGGAPGAGGFPYPEQWQQAGDIYGQLAGGMPAMPDPGAIWGGYQQQAGDLSRELAEQAGMGMGSRYGSALQRNIADVGMRAGERFGGEMERMRMGDVAGQRQAMLGAAGGLSGLGGAQAMLPGQIAGQAMGLGGQYQQMQQQEYDRMLQEFMRTQPEYSPYLPYMQQGAQVPYGPQTYQPGFGSNMMDIGSLMQMYSMMNPGGGQQSWLTRPW